MKINFYQKIIMSVLLGSFSVFAFLTNAQTLEGFRPIQPTKPASQPQPRPQPTRVSQPSGGQTKTAQPTPEKTQVSRTRALWNYLFTSKFRKFYQSRTDLLLSPQSDEIKGGAGEDILVGESEDDKLKAYRYCSSLLQIKAVIEDEISKVPGKFENTEAEQKALITKAILNGLKSGLDELLADGNCYKLLEGYITGEGGGGGGALKDGFGIKDKLVKNAAAKVLAYGKGGFTNAYAVYLGGGDPPTLGQAASNLVNNNVGQGLSALGSAIDNYTQAGTPEAYQGVMDAALGLKGPSK